MKKNILLLLSILCLAGSSAYGQRKLTRADVFTEPRIVWFGIDYSLVKMKGEYEAPGHPFYKSPQRIVEDFFETWNSVVVGEPGKYNVKRAFEKKMLENDIMVVEKRNAKVDPSTLVTLQDYTITKDQIAYAVSEYSSLTNKQGLGVVFFAECLNNVDKVGSYYVTFFDIATNEVLICERVMGKPVGAKLDTYWAGSIADALGDAHKLYKSWK